MTRLAVDWWICQRHGRRIREALNWGFAEHCYNIVDKGLADNKEKKRWPSSWTTYTSAAALSGDSNRLRKQHGEDATATHEFVGIATLIGASPQQLPPPKSEVWLVATVLYACEEFARKKISLKDAELFVHYCLRQFAKHQKSQAELTSKFRPDFAELIIVDADLVDLANELDVPPADAFNSISNTKLLLEACL